MEGRRRLTKNNSIRDDVRVATHLGYSDKVIEMLKKEKNANKRQDILRYARLGRAIG